MAAAFADSVFSAAWHQRESSLWQCSQPTSVNHGVIGTSDRGVMPPSSTSARLQGKTAGQGKDAGQGRNAGQGKSAGQGCRAEEQGRCSVQKSRGAGQQGREVQGGQTWTV